MCSRRSITQLLTGTLPATIGGLFSLTHLDLTMNALTGTIPAGIVSLSLLTFLSVGDNSLSGTIPAGMASLSLLQSLDGHSNGFSGPLPDFSSNNVIFSVFFDNNLLQGPFPSFGTSASQL